MGSALNAVQVLELQPIYDHLKNIVELDSFSHSIGPFTCDAATPWSAESEGEIICFYFEGCKNRVHVNL